MNKNINNNSNLVYSKDRMKSVICVEQNHQSQTETVKKHHNKILNIIVPLFVLALVLGIGVKIYATNNLVSIPVTLTVVDTPANVAYSVYSDSACTQLLTQISLGSIYRNVPTDKIFYVKNTGTASGTITFIGSSNDGSNIQIVINKPSTVIQAGQSTDFTATFTVGNDVINGSKQLTITGVSG